MKKIYLLIVILFYSFKIIQAKDISLYSGDITFMVPDEYVEIPILHNENIGFYSESDKKAMALFAYQNSNFSVSKVLEGLDSCLCDLKKYKLIDTEKEYFWNLTTDYVIRKYESENGQKFASYTRYVTKGAYCFGFWYNSNEDYKDFENLIESVHFSEENTWGQISLATMYSGGMFFVVLILLFIASFFAGAGGGNSSWDVCAFYSLCITFVAAIIFLIPLWSFWIAYLALLLVFFVVCFFCSYFGIFLTIGFD